MSCQALFTDLHKKYAYLYKGLITLLFLFPACSIATPLVNCELEYQLRWHGLPAGKSLQKLNQLSDHLYEVHLETQPSIPFLPFNYIEKNRFTLINGIVTPIFFEFLYKENGNRKQGTIDFEASKNKIVLHHQEGESVFNYPPKVQDKITELLQLAQDLPLGAQTFNYPLMTEKQLKQAQFKIIDHQAMPTEAGNWQTIVIEQIKGNQRKTILWIAPELNYMVVKMQEWRKDKLFIEGELKAYQGCHH